MSGTVQVPRSINYELRFSDLSGREKEMVEGFVQGRLKEKGARINLEDIKKVRVRFLKCSTTGCRCRRDPSYYHGPYAYVAYSGGDISLGDAPPWLVELAAKFGKVSDPSAARRCQLTKQGARSGVSTRRVTVMYPAY